MIKLQEKGLGTYKGIPTIILASASIDNLYCITAFYFMADMVFMEHGRCKDYLIETGNRGL